MCQAAYGKEVTCVFRCLTPTGGGGWVAVSNRGRGEGLWARNWRGAGGRGGKGLESSLGVREGKKMKYMREKMTLGTERTEREWG